MNTIKKLLTVTCLAAIAIANTTNCTDNLMRAIPITESLKQFSKEFINNYGPTVVVATALTGAGIAIWHTYQNKQKQNKIALSNKNALAFDQSPEGEFLHAVAKSNHDRLVQLRKQHWDKKLVLAKSPADYRLPGQLSAGKIVCESGDTGLHIVARSTKNAQISQYLLTFDADINALNAQRQTPLMTACSNLRDSRLVIFNLLAHKPDVNKQGYVSRRLQNGTALDCCLTPTSASSLEPLKILIVGGADYTTTVARLQKENSDPKKWNDNPEVGEFLTALGTGDKSKDFLLSKEYTTIKQDLGHAIACYGKWKSRVRREESKS